MSRIRIVGGTYTKITKGDHNIYAGGNITTTAGKAINETGAEHGIIYGDPEKPPVPPDLQIIKLVINTPQDKGYSDAGTLTDGLIYGKAYEIEAVLSTKDWNWSQVDQIKWYYEYTDENGKKISDTIKNTTTGKPEYGNKIRFILPNVDCCGNNITIKAVLNNTGSIGPWAHYRFRWIPRNALTKEVDARLKEPYLVNQKGTSLCGMACIFYLFAKNYGTGYKQYILDLHRKGKTSYNQYTAQPGTELWEKKVNESELYYADYMGLACTRNSENSSYKGGDEQFAAINWPWMMVNLSEKLLGYKNVESFGIYNPIKTLVYLDTSILKKIEKINEYKKNGFEIILMIDADLISPKDFWTKENFTEVDYHWVVLESPINVDYQQGFFSNIKNEIDFNVYTWGTNPFGKYRYLQKKITLQHFAFNYYGFIALK